MNENIGKREGDGTLGNRKCVCQAEGAGEGESDGEGEREGEGEGDHITSLHTSHIPATHAHTHTTNSINTTNRINATA